LCTHTPSAKYVKVPSISRLYTAVGWGW